MIDYAASSRPVGLHLKPPDRSRRLREGVALTAIISGGQTGVDVAGLRAGRALGLATGGWAPRGWRTLAGARPELGLLYGLQQCAASDYAARTNDNVRDSDATLRIAEEFSSAGERCTFAAINRFGKPNMALRRCDLDAASMELLREFLRDNNVSVLNVAGNSEQTAPGIGYVAEVFLLRALGDGASWADKAGVL